MYEVYIVRECVLLDFSNIRSHTGLTDGSTCHARHKCVYFLDEKVKRGKAKWQAGETKVRN